MLHLSHNHSAPRTSPTFANNIGGEFVEPYRAFLVESLIDLVEQAVTNRKESILSWQVGRCQLAFNRNFPDPETGDIVCGINPSVPADDTVLVGRVSDSEGEVTAVLVNYACHPTTLAGANTQLSPDYPGAMRALIEQTCEGALCLFLHGASGDLAPRVGYEGNPDIADQNGRELGYAALSALQAMLPPATQLEFDHVLSSGAPLGIWALKSQSTATKLAAKLLKVELDVKPMPDLATLKEALVNADDRALQERIRRSISRSHLTSGHKSLTIKAWIWQFGNSFVIGTPTELHSSFQIELRRQHPDVDIAVLNIVNGYASYLPPQQDYAANSYQVEVSLFSAGAAEKMLGAISREIGEMKA
jgi:hypothetical protein